MKCEILFHQGQIHSRIEELAGRITSDYEEVSCLTVVGVLKGALFFMADLLRRISLPVTIELVQVNTYPTGTKPSRRPEILFTTGFDPGGKQVLLVEDIVDTGSTLDFILQALQEQDPKGIRTCVLLEKKSARIANVQLDYVGFEIPDRFVVGYGLDWNGKYRNLPYIGLLDAEEP